MNKIIEFLRHTDFVSLLHIAKHGKYQLSGYTVAAKLQKQYGSMPPYLSMFGLPNIQFRHAALKIIKKMFPDRPNVITEIDRIDRMD